MQPAEPVPAGALETLPPQPGAWLQVEGRRAEVVRLGKRKLRVRFDDGSRQWVALEEVPAKSAARETPKPCVAPAVAARPGRALPCAGSFRKPLAVTAGGAGTERGVVRLGCTQTSGFCRVRQDAFQGGSSCRCGAPPRILTRARLSRAVWTSDCAASAPLSFARSRFGETAR